MRLKVLLPTEVLLDVPVTKVVAEGENGSFCLLPRHRDFVTAIVPGILSLCRADGTEEYLAVAEGVLVKSNSDVLVSTRNAVRSPDLGLLRNTVRTQFQLLDERERVARAAIAKLEADFTRRFIQLGERAGV